MSVTPGSDRRHSALGVDAVDLGQYVAIYLGDEGGDVLLFDERLSTAWIQSDVAVSVEEAV
ncbi:hypothetical protein [Haloarchaeobius sp. HRN-SO-5]|uniref:hypothetical protein n=1 Tax=Haloarchaeobius sp. HRN-SO-5 TaxID=3446118 RepID=UPI003EBE2AA5